MRDPTQATLLIVDQGVLEELDQAHLRYTVIQRFRGFRTDKINDLKRRLGRWIGVATKSPRPFSAILIANIDPFTPAHSATQTSQPTTSSTP